ncbi:hypothetical protein A2714_05190 [Candidatus Woesebacteria bacterium RIFCSPHIGHO2_01_FULL_38_9]|uniref:GIY-YIG domain-containing protein n=2 Tax=Candidatus Woeseibacteriota TaxID=1752722 RepID=A0A1F7Y0H0_9BACT|nr:MAG: hypothetical protein A2714_05190 [Candidatus Woesebacteria bacterium RIFCSPHIGHO2_01_FULL_38_9]OGM59030.1 MAG: hypothetical protein A3A75_05150 [Candidatus Woesebacteria bacterium RIFCSPLOWO2_01_FULL_39_10]
MQNSSAKQKFFYVYVLLSLKDWNLYIGVTDNLKRRISEHNKGLEISTKSRVPFKLIYCELFINKVDAFKREKYLKGGWGRKHLRSALKLTLLDSKARL